MDVVEDLSNIRNHGEFVDRKKERVKCIYCGKVISTFYRLKRHLGGIRGDVVSCEEVPENVMLMFRNMVLESKSENSGKKVGTKSQTGLPMKRNCSPDSNGVKCSKFDTSQSAGSRSANNEEMDSAVEDGATEQNPGCNGEMGSVEVEKYIGKFFYETGIDLNVASSSSFQRMINATLGVSQVKHKIPTPQELKGRILQDEVLEMQEYVTKMRQSWAKTGCSLLLDGWLDERRRHLVSFIVECPKGAIYLRSADVSHIVNDIDALQMLISGVMEEIGIDNLVQIIASSSTGWMDAVRKQFMEWNKTALWSVSASHCIKLMLEKIQSMASIERTLNEAMIIAKFIHSHAEVLKLMKSHTEGNDLIDSSWMKFAAPFYTLENIVSEKEKLEMMFASCEWKTLVWAATCQGKRVAGLVRDSTFWTGAEKALKATIPLMRVYCLIYEADKPLTGYIYDTIDQAKETIKEEFENKKPQYKPFWDKIDDVWNNYLHCPLHGAGYFLNPSIYYSDDFYQDEEVAFGLLCCVVRMVRDKHTQDLISLQLDKYRMRKGAFEEGSAIDKRNNVTSVQWWSIYGNQYPELQAFAIRVLSQTCDGASRYRLKRGLAEELLLNGRNAVEKQILTDLTSVHYNLHLRNNKTGICGKRMAEEMDVALDDWITDEAPLFGPQNHYADWMHSNDTGAVGNMEGSFRSHAKEEQD